MKRRSIVLSFLAFCTSSIILLRAAPAHALCESHNTGDPFLGKVEVCVHEEGSASVAWSNWDENGTQRLYVLVGPDYVGVCRDDPADPANCTPDLIEL